jgi:hypothetical protein
VRFAGPKHILHFGQFRNVFQQGILGGCFVADAAGVPRVMILEPNLLSWWNDKWLMVEAVCFGHGRSLKEKNGGAGLSNRLPAQSELCHLAIIITAVMPVEYAADSSHCYVWQEAIRGMRRASLSDAILETPTAYDEQAWYFVKP